MRHLPKPNRSMAPVMWYGGKGNLVQFILPHLSGGTVYVEPYCGAASMLFAKKPHPVEVLNDLDGNLVNFFRCLQEPSGFKPLAHRLRWTLYSREEFKKALRILKNGTLDPVERAWAFFVAQSQGFSGCSIKTLTDGKWGRVFTSKRGMADNTNSWRGRLSLLRYWHDRLSRVQIDSQCALKCIEYWDSEETLFYVDPPYVSNTRVKGSRSVYTHESGEDHHRKLVDLLNSIKGRAVLSGYANDIYDFHDWKRYERETACYAASKSRGTKIRGKGSALEHAKRTEVLWVNRAEEDFPLFSGLDEEKKWW